MVAADKPVISAGRAQDWINAINPILDGLKRELRFLPAGPWRWHPKTRSFESFLPVKDYIQHPYLDNYEDLLEKYEEVRQETGVRDGVLAAFAKEFERAFDALLAEQGSFKDELDAAAAAYSLRSSDRRARGDLRDPEEVAAQPDARAWFASYVVGNFGRLPDYYAGYDIYNERSDRLLAAARDVLAQAKIDVPLVAKQLEVEDNKLLKKLVEVRRDLADRYGARIRPS
jgi:hypothetical protein